MKLKKTENLFEAIISLDRLSKLYSEGNREKDFLEEFFRSLNRHGLLSSHLPELLGDDGDSIRDKYEVLKKLGFVRDLLYPRFLEDIGYRREIAGGYVYEKLMGNLLKEKHKSKGSFEFFYEFLDLVEGLLDIREVGVFHRIEQFGEPLYWTISGKSTNGEVNIYLSYTQEEAFEVILESLSQSEDEAVSRLWDSFPSGGRYPQVERVSFDSFIEVRSFFNKWSRAFKSLVRRSGKKIGRSREEKQIQQQIYRVWDWLQMRVVREFPGADVGQGQGHHGGGSDISIRIDSDFVDFREYADDLYLHLGISEDGSIEDGKSHFEVVYTINNAYRNEFGKRVEGLLKKFSMRKQAPGIYDIFLSARNFKRELKVLRDGIWELFEWVREEFRS